MTDKEMTNEEMTDKHAEEYCRQDDLGHFIRTTEEVKQADIDGFLAGLKEGKPKWHKVADGDLPKDENDVLVYSGEDWRMCVGRYSPKYKAWETGCDTIAWCEIPKYTEE